MLRLKATGKSGGQDIDIIPSGMTANPILFHV